MSQAPHPSPPETPGRTAVSGMGTGTKIAIGCGTALLAMVLVCGGVGFWFYSNFRSLAAGAAGAVLVEAIEQSELSEAQKTRITQRVEELKAKYAAGEVSNDELGQVITELMESPVFAVGTVAMLERQYLAGAEFDAAEKASARRALERYARGLYEEKIPASTLETVTAPITTRGPEGNQQLDPSPAPEALRQLIERAREEAEAAEIPDEPFEVDIADIFDEALDRALKK